MNRYKLIISYDGTNYSGWQVQPNAPSIQEHLEKATATFIKHPCRIIGSGRTDAGVHALGQVAHFETDQELDLHRALLAINALLPRDIRVMQIEHAEPTFHAQYSATGKIYHYHVWTRPIIDPFNRLYRCHNSRELSLPLLKEATSHFIGEKDFTTFANVGSSKGSNVRTLKRLDFVEQPSGFRLEFEGNGFLYKMVRNIVGTLFEVSLGKRSIEEIPVLFSAKDRRATGIAAPPTGLFLMQVNYT